MERVQPSRFTCCGVGTSSIRAAQGDIELRFDAAQALNRRTSSFWSSVDDIPVARALWTRRTAILT